MSGRIGAIETLGNATAIGLQLADVSYELELDYLRDATTEVAAVGALGGGGKAEKKPGLE